MKKTILFAALLFAFLTTSCSEYVATGTTLSTENKLVITGSSTIAPLATELAKAFELKNPDVRIDIQTGGSSRGISDVQRKLTNIGMVSRALKDSEKNIYPHLIAIDGVSLIVNADNPLTQLSEEQIKAIYRGEIHNWKTLNGQDKPIMVISKAEGRSTLEVFLNYFSLKNSEIKADAIIGDNEQAVKLVENNTAAIAYVSIGTAEYDIDNGSKIKTLPLNGIAATTENLADNTFPLSRELNFVTSDQTSELANKFLTYVLSQDAHPLIKEFGFVPINTR